MPPTSTTWSSTPPKQTTSMPPTTWSGSPSAVNPTTSFPVQCPSWYPNCTTSGAPPPPSPSIPVTGAPPSRHPVGSAGVGGRRSRHPAGSGVGGRRSRHPAGNGARRRRPPATGARRSRRRGSGPGVRRSLVRAAPTRPRFFTRRTGSLHTRRTIRRAVRSCAALRNMAALSICRMATTFRATERRRRHGSGATAGTTARRLATRRRTGKVRRLLVAGTGRRLPVVGTSRGLGHRVMCPTVGAISHRLPTTPTRSFQSSTGSTGVGVTVRRHLGAAVLTDRSQALCAAECPNRLRPCRIRTP